MSRKKHFPGLMAPVLGAVLAAGCAGKKEEPPKLASQEAAYDLRLSDEFVFKPDHFECAPGQVLRIRVTNSIPAGGPDLSHNVVFLRGGTDVEAFAQACTNASADQSYIPATLFAQVLGATPLVHPGHTEELLLVAPEAPGEYPVICSFPGHCFLGMRGKLTVR